MSTTYEPVMMQPIRLRTTSRELWMIYAADGTVLDAIDAGDVRPVWAAELTRLITVEVYPTEWRKLNSAPLGLDSGLG